MDQPLDLSTKSRRKSEYLSPPDVATAGGGPSSLLSLERQFGKGPACHRLLLLCCTCR